MNFDFVTKLLAVNVVQTKMQRICQNIAVSKRKYRLITQNEIYFVIAGTN